MTTRSIIGTDLNQVPTNGMLGGLAYQSPDHASIKDLDLKNISAINAETADTAVDVFVYDTSKDSDGGAWRKRTQHTSWYNEPLNTSTRGSRREFPAVAVIVSTLTKVTIYDGDDPDLPMWMVFNGGANGINNVPLLQYPNQNGYHLAALNGVLVIGIDTNGDNWGSPIINFISEYIVRMDPHASEGGIFNGGVAQRNDNVGFNSPGKLIIVSSLINDVAMTVLPRAPIDPDTGLQVPTIAVATDNGVSVIRDDGTVVNYTHTNATYDVTSFVEFLPDNRIAYAWDNNNTPRRLYITPIINADSVNADLNSYPIEATGTVGYGEVADDKTAGNYHGHLIGSDQSVAASIGDRSIAVGDGSDGLNLVDIQAVGDDTFNSLIAFATTSYNTGWMHGDIKGAFLADTDDTDLSAPSELITSGTFDTSASVSDWISSTSTLAHYATDNSLQITQTAGVGWAIQGFTTVVGKQYIYSIDAKQGDVSVFRVYIGTSYPSNATNHNSGTLTTGASYQTFTGYFTATATTTYIQISPWATTNNYIYVDNISVKEAEPDRSVNQKGLQVFGTVAKSAVATGAELVAYGPFSNSSYLYQPYNSDLDLGTGDFSIMVWVKSTNTGYVFWRNDVQTTPYWDIYVSGTADLRFRLGETQINITSGVNTTQWTFVCFTRSGSIANAYINGELSSTFTESGTTTNPDSPIYIGRRVGAGAELTEGYVSLMRISGSAPSAEQIKKIYDDEKVLFQENAKCTLYGSSDAVTALAYDDSTSLLHVGTSSGRSDFMGLKRINHTTTAVSTAISAQDGLIAQQ